MKPFLTRLQPHDYDLLMINAKEATFEEGEFVFKEGQPSDRLFFISKGTVRVHKELEPDKEITVFIRGELDSIGEIGIFSGDTYSNSAQTVEKTDVFYIEKKAMEQIIIDNGRIGLEFTRWIAESLEASKAKLRDYLAFGSEGAVASFFVRAANMYGKEMPDGILIKQTFTVQDIAKHLGISRETVSRIISKWRQQDVLEKKYRYYHIKDIQCFRDILSCEKCGVQNCVI